MPPPTRPNKAMELAPRLKPVSSSRSATPSTHSSTPRPSTPKPTTERPITAPPRKATTSAFFMLPVRAAAAVRTLAWVATFMPIKPASTDKAAPSKKHRAMRTPKPGSTQISTNTTATKTATVMYSRRKNAIAPSRIKPAISFMRASPASWPVIHRVSSSAHTSATAPAAGTTYIRFSIRS